MRHLAILAVMAVMLVGAQATTVASLPRAESGLVLVIAPLWPDAEAELRAAGGRVIGPLRAAFGTLATSDDPEFASRLRARGAWAVLDGEAAASLCGVKT